MKHCLMLLALLCSVQLSFGQIVSLSPSNAGSEDSAILTFDATEGNGELAGADKVYLHHGVVLDGPTGTEWNYVIGNWGQDDGVGQMEPVPGEVDKWQIEFAPSIREYFGVPANEDIFRISAVFRSADGNTKGTIAPGDYGWGTSASNQDLYINLNAGNFIVLNAPAGDNTFLNSGESISIDASASSEVSTMKIWIDEGSGFNEVESVSSGTSIEYTYFPSETGLISIRITATIDGEELTIDRELFITIIQPTPIEALPAGMEPGINYDPNDDTKVTLVLEAPGKEFAYVVGDFTDWFPQDNFLMKQSPDGEFFWLEVSGLVAQQEYVFQYWVDGEITIGDPYADKVADPWNDQWIDEETYPDLPEYDKTQYGIATVLQTGQEEYDWAPSEATWEHPDLDHIVIYELLVRDFLGSHSYADLIDTLSYIKSLGVDAIEIMPFNEFEGNESWGYNPSYYLAPDKYYGPKDDLKRLIEICHQEGLAVIMDMVLNHAYGQNPMVQLYFDGPAGKPAEDNPWFNREYVGPFSWGYDFNHESEYTERFIDRVNTYWLEEYHVDGYRFDFTKGFTNYAPGGNIDNFDQSRIDILKRMADEIWAADPEAYIILEHWGPGAEEQQLADYGMVMWKNRSYDYVPAMVGQNTGSFGGMDIKTHVSYYNSHDERRITEHALTEGVSNGVYDVKDKLIMYERAKMIAAFGFLFPGPKMMWQFDELGYDIDINFNGRVGNKPLPWGPDGLGYYEDPLRQHIYTAYQGILDVRKKIDPEQMTTATTDHDLNGAARRIVYDTPGTDLVLIGNFGIEEETIDPAFTQTGTWYDYFSGETIEVSDPNASIDLKAGQWHIYTNEQISNGFPGVVEIYDNPVTITPFPFTKNDEITITFDATRAWPGVTDGLVDAETVYMHSGVILEHPDSTILENVVGTLTDDGVGEMTKIGDNLWEIILTPADYYSILQDEDPYKIGMYFRDADNVNQGYGFRNSVIFANVDTDRPFITVEPPAFTIDDEITITFNARKGNQELLNADKVYMHGGAITVNTPTPHITGWQNVVGNWGNDDGVGQMTQVPNEIGLWEITLTPKDYYGLDAGEHVHWLSMVFRNADGSVKGTGTPGPIENGYIHTNQDFFIQNELEVNTTEAPLYDWQAALFPNPTKGNAELQLKGLEGNLTIEVMDLTGRVLSITEQESFGSESLIELNINNLPAGIYGIRLTHGTEQMVLKLSKVE